MKRFLCVILMLFVALTVCFAGCGAIKDNNKQTPADDGGNGQGQTTPTDEGGNGEGDETITVETGDNELPLVPFE